MANKNQTIFQRLNQMIIGDSVPDDISKKSNMSGNEILFSTSDKKKYDEKLSQYKQQKLLSYQWVKARNDISMDNLSEYTAVKLMYRDADLMDACPEIASALDIISEECCVTTSKGEMLHIYSKSGRIKAILEDLFFNRLDINTWLPSIARSVTKYGNEFFLLNITKDDGILGWRELPVYEIDRLENGYLSSYAINSNNIGYNDITPDEVNFVWSGHNDSLPYRNWQIAHFRLLNDSFFLPYGVSHLQKARRAWRMWSMMEDAMLISRLDRSIERRIFKIYVGGIDDSDVQAFVQDVANNFKRMPVIDPATGQVDLRKNFLDVSSDYFIPVRDPNAPTPIETLQGTTNQASMDDIQYMQNKILSALRVPKSFLNFQEAQGKGQNLSFIDTRFARMINKIQRYLLLELQKVAQIHLFLLGFEEEMSNFTLSLNNPSSQTKSAELDELTKKLSVLQTALSDPGNGIPMMSMHKALREIMDFTDNDIIEMLNEIRLEKAMAAELTMTPMIIKKTGMFDKVDRLYGDFDALVNGVNPQSMPTDNLQGNGSFGGGGVPIMNNMGGDSFDTSSMMDLGTPGSEMNGDINSGNNEFSMSNAPAADNGNALMENSKNQKSLTKSFIKEYLSYLQECSKKEDEYVDEIVEDFEGKNKTMEEKSKKLMNKINEILTPSSTSTDDDSLDNTEIDAINED